MRQISCDLVNSIYNSSKGKRVIITAQKPEVCTKLEKEETYLQDKCLKFSYDYIKKLIYPDERNPIFGFLLDCTTNESESDVKTRIKTMLTNCPRQYVLVLDESKIKYKETDYYSLSYFLFIMEQFVRNRPVKEDWGQLVESISKFRDSLNYDKQESPASIEDLYNTTTSFIDGINKLGVNYFDPQDKVYPSQCIFYEIPSSSLLKVIPVLQPENVNDRFPMCNEVVDLIRDIVKQYLEQSELKSINVDNKKELYEYLQQNYSNCYAQEYNKVFCLMLDENNIDIEESTFEDVKDKKYINLTEVCLNAFFRLILDKIDYEDLSNFIEKCYIDSTAILLMDAHKTKTLTNVNSLMFGR